MENTIGCTCGAWRVKDESHADYCKKDMAQGGLVTPKPFPGLLNIKVDDIEFKVKPVSKESLDIFLDQVPTEELIARVMKTIQTKSFRQEIEQAFGIRIPTLQDATAIEPPMDDDLCCPGSRHLVHVSKGSELDGILGDAKKWEFGCHLFEIDQKVPSMIDGHVAYVFRCIENTVKKAVNTFKARDSMLNSLPIDNGPHDGWLVEAAGVDPYAKDEEISRFTWEEIAHGPEHEFTVVKYVSDPIFVRLEECRRRGLPAMIDNVPFTVQQEHSAPGGRSAFTLERIAALEDLSVQGAFLVFRNVPGVTVKGGEKIEVPKLVAATYFAERAVKVNDARARAKDSLE